LEQRLEDQAVKTLFLPFETGELPFPGAQDRWLFLNATVPEPNDFDWSPTFVCVQGFRPTYLSLVRAGYKTLPELDADANYSGALILLGKHRELNRRYIHLALERTCEGATILVAGAKTVGIESMRREVSASMPVETSWSKHHAQVFQIKQPANSVRPTKNYAISIEVDGFSLQTAPGMFSHTAVDAGSSILAPHVGGLKGSVADFGAGWGYLSVMALRSSTAIESIHLYEADHSSLQAAIENLGRISSTVPKTFNWSDLTQEFPSQSFDIIIMNPPFHVGGQTEPDIGKRFIEAASASLKQGGQLLMVANKQLPYEDTLQRSFRHFERVSEDRLYKVIRAAK
jgi:16S rRNA (guanine1207-N2)-methyltransferase